MITHPSATELEEALAAFQAGSPDDPRANFLVRVADNARATLEREAVLAPAAREAATNRLQALLDQDGDFESLNAQLCAALRAGRLDPLDHALLAHLRASALDQIAIDQPGYSGAAALIDAGA
ncbi:MAG: protein kinase [Caulobacter sp.]|nr:protein kinase [Caulobacter sp.]